MIHPGPQANGRPAEQVAGRYIPVVVGGETRRLRVLWINENSVWVAMFHDVINRTAADVIGGAEGDTMGDVATKLRGQIDVVIELLVGYDLDGTLGGAEYLKAHATDADLWDALKDGVLRAAFPLEEDLASVRMLIRQETIKAIQSSTSTKPSPANTAGRRRRSKGN